MKRITRFCFFMLALFLIAAVASLPCCAQTSQHEQQGLATVGRQWITSRDVDLCMAEAMV